MGKGRIGRKREGKGRAVQKGRERRKKSEKVD